MKKKNLKSIKTKQILPNRASHSAKSTRTAIYLLHFPVSLENLVKGKAHYTLWNSPDWMAIHRLQIPDKEGEKRNVPSKSWRQGKDTRIG